MPLNRKIEFQFYPNLIRMIKRTRLNTKRFYFNRSQLRAFVITIFFLFRFSPQFSQSYSFTGYSVEDGLPFIQIYALYQDTKGYLWSGGYGGLSRFNGKNFEVYNPREGLSDHWVTSITESPDKKLWIGTIDGLNSFDGTTFKNYYRKDNLFSDYINSLITDRKGNIWVCTQNGLNVIDKGTIRKISSTAGLNVQCIFVAAEDELWIGTSTGLLKLSTEGKILGKLNNTNGLPNENITAIKQDERGRIIAGTKSGLAILNQDLSGLMVFSVSTGLFDPNVTSLLIDEKKNLWIGTNSGLVKYDGKKFSYLQLTNEANTNKISALSLDYEHNIWIGTYNGLYKFRGEMLVNYGPQDGLSNPFIFDIDEDKTGRKWITTENGGIYVYDGTNFKNYTIKDGLPSNKSTTMYFQQDGSILFGTDAGYSVFKNEKFTNYSFENGFNLLSVNTFFKDSKGRIWAGSRNGLAYLTESANNKFDYTYFTLPSEGKDYEVWGFAEDAKGNIWIGTYLAGLYKFDGKEIKKYESPQLEKSLSVLEMVVLRGKYLFGATLDGVMQLNTESGEIKFITENDGLNSDLTYALLLTKDKKKLWAGTNQGVNQINIENYLNTGKVELVSFGKTDGIKGVELNTHGLFEDAKGHVWIGTVNGLSRFNPEEYMPNTIKPKLNLTNTRLFYNDTLLENNSELPYYLNNISFHYIGICLTNPSKVKYITHLVGLEKNPSPETAENFKTYSNLPPGKYTFKVSSCNNEGVWNRDAIQFTFTIRTPWFKTWWFTVIILAVLAAILLLIFRIKLNQERARQKIEFGAQVEIAKNELKALRAQINPHFIFNSLNSIQHFIIENNNEEATRYLNKFARLFRMILNNSEKSSVSIREEVDMLTVYLELESMRFQNKFEYEIIIDPKIDPDYEEMPTMLLQPYLENAILHGLTPKKEKGKLTVKITSTAAFLICTIEDNGIGRKRAGEMKTSQKASEKHKSLGMKITQDRLKLLNQLNDSELSMNITDLCDKDGNPAGTRVDIYIPII